MSDVNFTIVKPDNPEISHAEFVQAVIAHFPTVEADILDEEQDHIYAQVACLTRYGNACIESNNLLELERILRFVDQVLPKVDSSLDNALHVSFIEMLYLDGEAPVRQAARALLSPWQLDFYLAIVEFYGTLPKKIDTSQ
jgi:hypothetical protein